MEKISVQRALTKIKTIDERIKKKSGTLVVLGLVKDGNLISGENTKEFERNATADYNSIVHLLRNKAFLRARINESNIETMVLIDGEKISVAEAILMKDFLKEQQSLSGVLKTSLANVEERMLDVNKIVERNALGLASNALGKENVELGDSDVSKVIEPYMKANKLSILDPISVRSIIREFDKKNDEFFAEIDIVLSESNAITKIESE